LFEFLLDAANIQPAYSLYITLILGLTVQLIWILKVEFLFINTLQTSSEYHIQVKNLSMQMKRRQNFCTHLTWIIRYIRRKENPGDEPDHYFLIQ
jgi:hypothetical protein